MYLMADRALQPQTEKKMASPPGSVLALEYNAMRPVKRAAARLYGQGYERRQIARILLPQLVPNGLDRPLEQRLSQARGRLKQWERNEQFRDVVYNHALVELDMSLPGVLKGVAKKAKKGRVDAARLVLEVSGRHNPKGESTPTQVAIVVNGVPRPDARAVDPETIGMLPPTDDEV